MSTWKRDFASGLVLLLPLLAVLLVLRWIIDRIAGTPLVGRINYAELGVPEGLVPAMEVLIAITLFVVVVFAAGYFMRTTMGRVVEGWIDGFMNQIPALRVVYNASKLAVETALSGTEDLQAPVHLETWAGVRMTAFKTGKRTRDGKVVLFMPTAPNITSGFVVEVDEERITETGETVEEALTRILSAGFAESPHQIPVEEATSGGERSRPKVAVGRTDGKPTETPDG